MPSPRSKRTAARIARLKPTRKSNERPVFDRRHFTHTEKVLFPATGLTKADVLSYYQAIAPRLLPYLQDRPVTLERLPDGVADGAPRFWQKNTPDYYPSWIPRIELPTETGKEVKYALVNNAETLLYLVNQGALTFHVWPSRVGSLDMPDYVIFDLDRSEATFADVIEVAKRLHKLLAARKVEAAVQTTGKSGLHVMVPWSERTDYDAARTWAMKLAGELVRELPNRATTERLKSGRHGHVYVDVIQNARGHHVVPPYVIRAVPEATVSTPLEWKELNARLDPARFTPAVVLARLNKLKTDPLATISPRG